MRAMQYKPQALEAARPSTARVPPSHVQASHAVDRNNTKNKENIGLWICVKGLGGDALTKEFGLKRECGLNAQEGTLKREVSRHYLMHCKRFDLMHVHAVYLMHVQAYTETRGVSSVADSGPEMLMHVQAF
jgi:hypothetical protein